MPGRNGAYLGSFKRLEDAAVCHAKHTLRRELEREQEFCGELEREMDMGIEEDPDMYLESY